MNRYLLPTVVAGLLIGALIAVCLQITTAPDACAATPNPTLRKATPAGKPTPRPTVTITRHGTYKLDVDTDDDCD